MNCRTCAGPCCLKGSNHEGDCEGYKPMTHYEQIKAMSIEEMAEWLCDVAGWLPMYEGKMHPILDWLRQEAE